MEPLTEICIVKFEGKPIRLLLLAHRIVFFCGIQTDFCQSYAQAGKVMKKNERQIAGLAYRTRAALKKRLESGGLWGCPSQSPQL